jgi:hypothetical protein
MYHKKKKLCVLSESFALCLYFPQRSCRNDWFQLSFRAWTTCCSFAYVLGIRFVPLCSLSISVEVSLPTRVPFVLLLQT